MLDRARRLIHLSRAPAEHVARHRRRLHQQVRELRASTRRRLEADRRLAATHALVLSRKATAAAGPEATTRRQALDGAAAALTAHDPDRTLERGYAIVDDGAGTVVTSAEEAVRARPTCGIRFADAAARARITGKEDQ